jgi:UDP-N-acetylmuramate dehydrogenase
MLLDPTDPNRRSAGSFFTNPLLDATAFEALVARAVSTGVVASPDDVPRFEAPGGLRNYEVRQVRYG